MTLGHFILNYYCFCVHYRTYFFSVSESWGCYTWSHVLRHHRVCLLGTADIRFLSVLKVPQPHIAGEYHSVWIPIARPVVRLNHERATPNRHIRAIRNTLSPSPPRALITYSAGRPGRRTMRGPGAGTFLSEEREGVTAEKYTVQRNTW